MTYKFFKGDVLISGSDALSFPNKVDASVDLASGYILTANGTKGVLTLTTNGSTATNNPFSSPVGNLIVLSNTVIDENSTCILTTLSSSAATKGYGIDAKPYLTVDNQHQFLMINTSGDAIGDDTEIKILYTIIK